MFRASDSNHRELFLPANSWLLAVILSAAFVHHCSCVHAQDDTTVASTTPDPGEIRKSGYWFDVPADLSTTRGSKTSFGADQLVAKLHQLASTSSEGERTSVVLRLGVSSDGKDNVATSFEDALKVARTIGQPELRQLKVVTFVDGELTGHRLLIAIATEQILMSETSSIGNATDSDGAVDETVSLAYDAIARRRNLLSPAIITAMLEQESELALISVADGQQRLAASAELAAAREKGQVLSEEVLKQPGVSLRLTASQLRDARAVGGIVNSITEAADVLDLAELVSADSSVTLETPRGQLIEIDGSIAMNRARRWRSNLAASLESGEVNTWLVEFDSNGGSLDTSVSLAATFAIMQPPLQTAAGFISGEARGDSAIMAIACRPLMMAPDARLGGSGSESIVAEDVKRHDELIEQIAKSSKRSPSLIRALLNPELEVYRYSHRKTGRIRYASANEIAGDDVEQEQWERGEKIDLTQGLSVTDAIKLGLAEAQVSSLDEAAQRIGLESVPPTIADRPLVRFVEKIGRSNGLMFLLLMIGFFTLSAEASTPGLGVPGFISILCFALYFWMKFLAGTAEWLELISLVLGLTFIAIEIFVVPGVGVFGVGGLVLTVLGIVLMSQTFIIPQNTYQIEVFTRGVWVALGALVGMVGGFVAMRSLMPHVPILNEFIMESDDAETLDRHERLTDYNHLAGQIGVATTMLRPSGKAKFGDVIVGVVSDGSPIEPGGAIRVREVLGNRIVVESVES